MPEEQTVVEKIRANAALVVRIAAEQLGEQVGYDEAGVRWLDGYLQGQHESGDPAVREGLIHTLGAFLGECIIATHGGEWAEVQGRWGIRFEDGSSAHPFAKVSKQLENGREDSVLSFFTILPALWRHLRGTEQTLRERVEPYLGTLLARASAIPDGSPARAPYVRIERRPGGEPWVKVRTGGLLELFPTDTDDPLPRLRAAVPSLPADASCPAWEPGGCATLAFTPLEAPTLAVLVEELFAGFFGRADADLAVDLLDLW